MSALLGLERSLQPLNRSAEMVPDVRRRSRRIPPSTALYGVAVRTYGAAGMPDSLRRAVERWTQLAPKDETPYREWGNALLARRDRPGARAAYLAGRQQLGPTALAPELAQLAVLESDYASAAREWLLAIKKLPGYRSAAIVTLRPTPDAQRGAVLKVLDSDGSPDALRLDAELRARWGDPLGGFERLVQVLPADPVESRDLLRQFAEALRGSTAPAYRQAMGRALEAMAQRTNGAQRSRLQLDAAQAYLDGGDRASARRMLASLAGDGESPAALSASASGTLLRLLVEEGKMEEAEKQPGPVPRGALDSGDGDVDPTGGAGVGAGQGSSIAPKRSRPRTARWTGWRCGGSSSSFRVILRPRWNCSGPRVRMPAPGSRPRRARRSWRCCSRSRKTPCPSSARRSSLLERGDTTAAVAGFAAVGAKRPRNKGGAELLLLAGRLRGGAGAGARGREALPCGGGHHRAGNGTGGAPRAGAAACEFWPRRRSGAGVRTADPGLSAERAGAPGAPRAR